MSPEARLAVVVEEHDRYHRQELISWWDQDRLRRATMLVVGAGALGNELAKNLALAGVGTIVIVDLDRIENSNLARCVFFREADEGRYKAEVLAERLRELNPDVRTLALVGDVRLRIGLAAFAEFDVVLGGLDNREARLFVNQACWKTTTPFVDGAIEGLLGSVRVFVPPDSACYECTMNERDYELLAARRSCALLSHDEMAGGKVPTTGTSASIVAGIQVQEAIKLLHGDRIGPSPLAGAGFQFVGLTHDSYVVRYPRRSECLSHDTYELAEARHVSADTTFGELLQMAREQLGPEAALDLEHEIAISATCATCAVESKLLRPVDSMNAGDGLCPTCGEPWQLRFAHTVEDDSPLLPMTAAEIGLPAADVIVGRTGFDRRFFVLTGGASAIGLLSADDKESA